MSLTATSPTSYRGSKHFGGVGSQGREAGYWVAVSEGNLEEEAWLPMSLATSTTALGSCSGGCASPLQPVAPFLCPCLPGYNHHSLFGLVHVAMHVWCKAFCCLMNEPRVTSLLIFHVTFQDALPCS